MPASLVAPCGFRAPRKEVVLGLGVQACRRLVEHLRQRVLWHHRPPQRQFLPLAPRELDPALPVPSELRLQTPRQLRQVVPLPIQLEIDIASLPTRVASKLALGIGTMEAENFAAAAPDPQPDLVPGYAEQP